MGLIPTLILMLVGHVWSVPARVGSTLPPGQPAAELSRPDPRIDPVSGSDTRVWPPDQPFEFRTMILSLDVPDMGRPDVGGTLELVVAPVGSPRETLVLDAGERLLIDSVTVEGAPVTFRHDPERAKLSISLGRPFADQEPVHVRITYSGESLSAGQVGLVWSDDDPITPNEEYLLHAQGHLNGRHLWFPCLDWPSRRTRVELIVTVPEAYEVVSGGRLASLSQNAGRRTFRYVLDQPAPFGAIGLIVGKFKVTDLTPATIAPSAPLGISLPTYVPASSVAPEAFGLVPEMLGFFEGRFGVGYPWRGERGGGGDRLALVVVHDLAPTPIGVDASAGMIVCSDRSGAPSATQVARGVAAQWFGGLIAPSGPAHAWVTDGFGLFGGVLWAEHAEGPGGAGALAEIGGAFEEELDAAAGLVAPMEAGMSSFRVSSPEGRGGALDRARRGMIVLHMLRRRLGDEAFFGGVTRLLRMHRSEDVETDDLRLALEESSGESLERFFDQWVHRPGAPEIQVDLAFIPDGGGTDPDGSGTLNVKLRQVQPIDADNPAYAVVVPLEAEMGPVRMMLDIPIETREAEMNFDLPSRPESVVPDPGRTVLARWRITSPLASRVRPATSGATP